MEKALCCINRKKITVLGLNSLFSKLSSFLLKQSPHINRLALYDECETTLACDISHINTQCKIRAYVGQEQLGCAVKNADIVLIGDQENVTTLVPHHKRNLQKDSTKLLEYACAIAEHAPSAIILVATTPVNSLLPLVSEFLIDCGVYDCNKVLGVTSVDNVRANKLAADLLKMDPGKVVLPVIGGSSPDTRVPIFSQARPSLNISRKKWLAMTWEIKNTETVIQRSRGRAESVNKAYATVRLIHSVLAALRGEPNIAEIVLARTILVPDTPYFALPVILGPQGIKYRFNLPALTQSETILVEHAAKCVNRDAEAGLQYLSSRYFKTEKTIDTRGLVGNLLQKIRGKDEKEVEKKPEYLLMTDKKYTDFNPQFKPSNDPINIPYVENDNCPNCNKGCSPIKLPVPPSKPRRTSKLPPNFNRDTGKVNTPFAPVENKDKFNIYKSNCPKCDYCNKPTDFCTCEQADKSPFEKCECTKSKQSAQSPPEACSSQGLTSGNVKEERIKVRAQRLLEERQREAKRRSKRTNSIQKKGFNNENSSCPKDSKTKTECKDKKEDKKYESECTDKKNEKDPKTKSKDKEDSTKSECKDKSDGNKKPPPSVEKKDDCAEKKSAKKKDDCAEKKAVEKKDDCAEKKDKACTKDSKTEEDKRKDSKGKDDTMKFSSIWPEHYGNREDFCDLKRKGIDKLNKQIHKTGREYNIVGKEGVKEPQVKKKGLPKFLFPSNMEPICNILSKEKNLLNNLAVKLVDPKVLNEKSNQTELKKKPDTGAFYLKCLSFLKSDIKPRKQLKKENKYETREEVENEIQTESKKPLLGVKTNPTLIGLLNSPQNKNQKATESKIDELKSTPKNEPSKIETLNKEVQPVKTKEIMNSISTPLPPVLTQEHAMIQEKINQFSKLRSEQLSKIYAPKCSSHLLHGHYPDYSHTGKVPQESNAQVVKPKEFQIPVVKVQDFEDQVVNTNKEINVKVVKASNEFNVNVISPNNINMKVKSSKDFTIPVVKDPKNYTINAPKKEFTIPVIKAHKEFSSETKALETSKISVQSKSVHTDEACRNLSPLYMTKSRTIALNQKSYSIVSPPSSEEVQANYSKNFDTLAKLNSQGCKNCELCKKFNRQRNNNISVKVTSPVHREFGVNIKNK